MTIDYILELTPGVTGRIVDVLRKSARVAIGRHTARSSIADLQLVGERFAADLGTEWNVSHHFHLIVLLTLLNEETGQQLVKLTPNALCDATPVP